MDEPNFVNLTPAVKGARSNNLATDRREQEDLCGVVNEGGDVRVGSTVVWCWRKSLEIPPPRCDLTIVIGGMRPRGEINTSQYLVMNIYVLVPGDLVVAVIVAVSNPDVPLHSPPSLYS